jgi:hypothetical protein
MVCLQHILQTNETITVYIFCKEDTNILLFSLYKAVLMMYIDELISCMIASCSDKLKGLFLQISRFLESICSIIKSSGEIRIKLSA